MDVESRVDLISRNALEIITREDAITALQTSSSPKGYIGVEPSGLFHLGWLIWVNKFRDMMKAGIKMTLLEATWHAWINDKFGGDLKKIHACAKYIEHSLTALGIDLSEVNIVKADALVEDKAYWEGILRTAKQLSLSRIKRAVTIMGRKEDEASIDFSKLIYPCMQVEDIFYLDLDFCLGGMDQRRAHVLAREVAEAYSIKKPVAVHTPLLSALQGGGRMDVIGDEEGIIDMKMSKSKPDTCIFIHDSPEQIRSKIASAYCPPKTIEMNPVLDIAKYILMWDRSFELSRPAKYGGNISFETQNELIESYRAGLVHPLDLKNGVSDGLISLLDPVRRYFSSNTEASDLLRLLCPR
ncbi:MAG: tyrosine--tRNA ligase [Candidatus Methanosuratincola verstraetei]|jgi:tyrosyl-tRNA synthetase|uniref:tyrosine--tRNA ligase n=1 Tax=Methanosuratincola subterraneus TaxID=2593994 RepID=A0A3S3RC03_METS7|nr:MAG: Tyrosyl-tRNA synthetase [Candidatus Methanosuratincola subterraneus]